MRIVVDANIVFSAILNSNGLIGELLFNTENQFDFYAPEFMLSELPKHKTKLSRLSKMSFDDIDISISQVLKNVKLISPDAISILNWEKAFSLTANVDEDDTPFVATALAIEGSIWTGDKKLISGLQKNGYLNIHSTTTLFDLTK